MSEVEPLSSAALAIAAIAQASAALVDLAEKARWGDAHDLKITEVVEQLADATKLSIEASGRLERHDEDVSQVYAALCRYLEGWA